jgi:hypothetical protein
MMGSPDSAGSATNTFPCNSTAPSVSISPRDSSDPHNRLVADELEEDRLSNRGIKSWISDHDGIREWLN